MRIILLTVWVTVLIIANLFMFGVILRFSKCKKKDEASRVGFGFMKILAVSNIITIGGLLWAL